MTKYKILLIASLAAAAMCLSIFTYETAAASEVHVGMTTGEFQKATGLIPNATGKELTLSGKTTEKGQTVCEYMFLGGTLKSFKGCKSTAPSGASR